MRKNQDPAAALGCFFMVMVLALLVGFSAVVYALSQ